MTDGPDSPPLQHRVRILAVGSNAVSAFYSWRLASSKACEVTVVWRRNWQAVQDYGIAFQSDYFGSERWKPAHVVQQVEDAAEEGRPYDYVLVCVKVIPELYELADVIADVVTPSHTCILLNTTTTIGVEKSLGTRFPKNLIVSLVNFAELNQTGGFEFEHIGDSAKVWIGTALRNDTIPEETQQDMAESLALTLEAGNVDCHVSHNILQQQWEKMMGPIAFHCMSVIAQEPNFKALMSDAYSNRVVRGVLSECLDIARRQNCTFPKSYVNDIISSMTSPFPAPDASNPLDPNLFTTMYQDLLANRPLEFEVYLGNPVRMAEELGIEVPNLQALYAVARHMNKSRTKGDVGRSPQIIQQPRQHVPRQSVQSIVNGRGRGIGPRSFSDGPPAVVTNGRGRPPPPPGAQQNGTRAGPTSRRNSFEGEFDQFKDIALYADKVPSADDQPNGDIPPHIDNNPRTRAPPPPASNVRAQSDYDIRSRELMLRERELQLREREIEIQRRQGRIRHNVPSTIMDDDEDEETGVPPGNQPVSQRQLMSTGDNFDMMSMTGRRARNKQALPPVAGGRGKQPFPGGDPNVGSGGGRLMSLGGGGRNKSGRSASVMSVSQATFDPLNENPLMGFTSNRYPGVDTRTLTANSRANSLTSQRMDELGMGPGGGRTASMLGSNSAYPSMSRGPPPLSGGARGGPMMRGRPMPPPSSQQQHGLDYGGPQNLSRGYPVDSSSILAPSPPAKDLSKVRSTTGSASASSASLGGNGESHSSSSSLEPPFHSQIRF